MAELAIPIVALGSLYIASNSKKNLYRIEKAFKMSKNQNVLYLYNYQEYKKNDLL